MHNIIRCVNNVFQKYTNTNILVLLIFYIGLAFENVWIYIGTRKSLFHTRLNYQANTLHERQTTDVVFFSVVKIVVVIILKIPPRRPGPAALRRSGSVGEPEVVAEPPRLLQRL